MIMPIQYINSRIVNPFDFVPVRSSYICPNIFVTPTQIIDAAKEAGISAVIASDVAVMTYCQKVEG